MAMSLHLIRSQVPTFHRLHLRPHLHLSRKLQHQLNVIALWIATENLHRLAPISFWAKTLNFFYIVDGKRVELGHTVVVWKDTPNTNVKVIDSSGTFELQTMKTDLPTILGAMEEVYSINAKAPVKLLGRFDGDKRMVSSSSTPAEADPTALEAAYVCLIGCGTWRSPVGFQSFQAIGLGVDEAELRKHPEKATSEESVEA